MPLSRWTRPRDYIGASWPEYFVFLAQHRDSDALTRSNFAVALNALKALPEWTPPDDDSVSRYIVRESHWAVGWVEWIAIHESDTAAIDAAAAMLARLENYPVLSEEHYSDLQWAEAEAYWSSESVAGRLDILRRSHSEASPFSARHDWLPADDSDRSFDYLTTE